ncbi:hypothetical protein NSQ77_21340 [Oceanobacillus sp. FSL K6-2867]|uniref:hypothetical protein n=1 Tax=Oceanobacillus sp. FSL K6-2867 TaxID=2954748 RepID=UPI0030DCE5E7
MKKNSLIMNEHGIVLPYVIFITTLVFMFIMTAIHSYKQDIALTQRHIQQVKIETLFQMGYETVKAEMTDQQPPNSVSYHFPDGSVSIAITPAGNTMYELSFTIKTYESDTTFAFTKIHSLTP